MNLEDIAMDAMKNYEFWCTSPYFDEATKAELLAIKTRKRSPSVFTESWSSVPEAFAVFWEPEPTV